MNPKTTALAIIEDKGKILLLKRNTEPFRGYWCLPGGHIEQYEPAEAAIKREVKEETNLDFTGKLLTYSEELFPELEWHAIALVFIGTGQGDIKINEESTEYKWIPAEDIDKYEMAFNHKDALTQFMEEKNEPTKKS